MAAQTAERPMTQPASPSSIPDSAQEARWRWDATIFELHQTLEYELLKSEERASALDALASLEATYRRLVDEAGTAKTEASKGAECRRMSEEDPAHRSALAHVRQLDHELATFKNLRTVLDHRIALYKAIATNAGTVTHDVAPKLAILVGNLVSHDAR